MGQIAQLLPNIQKLVKVGNEERGKLAKQGIENLASEGSALISSRMKQISDKLSGSKGDAGDLFALTDVDGNGKINMEEFNMCTVRLGYKLNPSRVNEIFSRCKKDLSAEELNEQEFKEALDYLQTRVATTSHMMLGKSWGTLMLILCLLTFILFLLLVFIFLGMSAFTQGGGTFNAVINSCMTLVAGVGMMKGGKKNDSEDQKKTKDMVGEVHDT